MAVKKSPPKAAKKAAAKKAPAKAPAKKVAASKAPKKAAPKKAAPKKEAIKKTAVVKKAPAAKPVKASKKPAKATVPSKSVSPKIQMITKTKPQTGKRFADEKPKKAAPVVEKKPVKKEEPVRMTRKLLIKDDPRAIIDAVPLQPIKTFNRTDVKNFGVQEKLQTIYYLQQIHSHIDHINIIRGELPMEVKDLVEEVNNLQKRVEDLNTEITSMQDEISKKKLHIKDATAQIKKYESQQMNVKNNREYDSLTKEIEYQQLDIQLSEKRIKEHSYDLKLREDELEATTKTYEERKSILEQKQRELDAVVAETIKEEERLEAMAAGAEKLIEENLLRAYKRIRSNMANGLAVVKIERDSCGGCFNKIPPQLQLEIAQRKRLTFCEHCGRLIVDVTIDNWE